MHPALAVVYIYSICIISCRLVVALQPFGSLASSVKLPTSMVPSKAPSKANGPELEKLLQNNRMWAEEKKSTIPTYFQELAKGQTPRYFWIGSSDSTVPAETLTKTQPGEVFVHRNIGNQVVPDNPSFLSVLTYAIEYLKVEDIIVCGHYNCGGVALASSDEDFGAMEDWLTNIREVLRENEDLVAEIEDPNLKQQRYVEINIKAQCLKLQSHPTVLKAQAANNGFPRIHGLVFDSDTGILKDIDSIAREVVNTNKKKNGIKLRLASLLKKESRSLPESEAVEATNTEVEGTRAKLETLFNKTPSETEALSPLTKSEVLECQAKWASAIKKISKAYLEKGDYIGVAAEAAGELYGYGHSNVLFKPTKAAEYPFRPTANEAMSYFVGGKVVDGGYSEDGGFAINGGKGWKDVVFTNHQIELNGNVAIAMGSYVFTCATTGEEAKVEYTFGYKRNADGKARICLHHSSVPYSEPGSNLLSTSPLTESEVLECQAKWASAIKRISKAYLDKGDYIDVAAEAAGELYGYGHSNVLFKPTKAAEYPFRPTANEAMSYFVGGNVVDGGYSEDGGFAINGGKGWKDVAFTNHQIHLNGDMALAMGSYVFTCATTGEEAKVEYTFGYSRNDDGKARIFLHHSSVPYSE